MYIVNHDCSVLGPTDQRDVPAVSFQVQLEVFNIPSEEWQLRAVELKNVVQDHSGVVDFNLRLRVVDCEKNRALEAPFLLSPEGNVSEL